MAKKTVFKCDQCGKNHDEHPTAVDAAQLLVTLKIPSRQSAMRNEFHFCDVNCMLGFLHVGDYIHRAGWHAHFVAPREETSH